MYQNYPNQPQDEASIAAQRTDLQSVSFFLSVVQALHLHGHTEHGTKHRRT